MNELMHDWGEPRHTVLQDATLVTLELEREEVLDYLDSLPRLGIGTVELPLIPAVIESARELGLQVFCAAENQADLELAAASGVSVRVEPELVLAAAALELSIEVRLAEVGGLPPHRLARWLEGWRSVDRLQVCLEDEHGRMQPEGLTRLLEFTSLLQRQLGTVWPVVWSQQDQGMALCGALTAIESGVAAVRCTGLGLGGWISLDQLLVNLSLESRWDGPTEWLAEYCRELTRMAGLNLSPNHPLAGRDAFRTSTGPEARGMWGASRQGREDLVDRISSGIPARQFGFRQVVEVGPMSGQSNVLWWLAQHSLPQDETSVERILQAAQTHFRSLTEDEIRRLLEEAN